MTGASQIGPPRLILASASASRAAMLRNAGLEIEILPAAVDEDSVKRAVRPEGGDTNAAAGLLAGLKARRVSRNHPHALVIGADQMLQCGADWYDKPVDAEDARVHLRRLRGKSHMLVTAAVVARDDMVIWSHTDTATLHMRPFSDAFLDDYLDRLGTSVTETVGCYRLEGPGAQLFSRIDGDFFTILGLPLLPLLDFLRGHGILIE